MAATNLFVPMHTHRYPPKGMIAGGGPGELLNVDGTNFRQIALQISADVPYPSGYNSWRNAVISSEYQLQQDACLPGPARGSTPKVPSGQLRGAIAASAFCAWVLDWRRDTATGRQAAAARDARVISGALRCAWEGLTPSEIAMVTGAPTSVVRVRLHRARTRLKRRLADAQTTAPEAEAAILSAQGGVIETG